MAAAGSRILRGPNKALRKTTKTPLNIIAMLSAVGIHEPSSKPKPAAPRRSAKPTLTSREFMVASPAPRKTPRMPTYGLVTIPDPPDGAGVDGAFASVAVTGDSPSLPRPVGANGRDHG